MSREVGSVSEDHFHVGGLDLNPSDFLKALSSGRDWGGGVVGLVPFPWAHVWRLEVNI